ncbi:MAG: phosphodiesterase [Sphingomonadaceae bacterium]|nr:phosphodiesterase [Sphingomonadaceae bacterium]
MLIAQITDIHVGFERGNPDEYNLKRLGKVLRRLSDGPNRPDLLLMSGDLTEYGDAESYARLADAVAQCPVPIWPMMGNHDLRGPLLDAFPQTPASEGFVQYALDLDGLRLIILDTTDEWRHGGAFCDARARWLASELEAHPSTPTVIAMHHPPFESGIAWMDCDADEQWIARFTAAVSGHRQIVSILSGHLHRNIHTLWNGIALSVCPSTAPLVALDLGPIDSAKPDGRTMISDEPPALALHRWDGRQLVTHTEAVGDFPAMAHFDEAMQPVVRLIESERRDG